MSAFDPIFERIAGGVVARERDHVLPFEPIAWLRDAGFTAVRVPVDYGGGGADLPELFALLTELSAADPNVTQALRAHFAFVEDRLHAPDGPDRDGWLRRFAAGELVGNAVTEIGGGAGLSTRITPDAEGGGWTISGKKYYTTGSIFADWIDAVALGPGDIEVAALVATATDAVTIVDDWAGFGQRLTGSGTTVFDAAPVRAEHVYACDARFPHQTAYYQLVLNAILAGIARAAERDLSAAVARRTRSYSHGTTAQVRDDPQILELVGRVSAKAFAAEAAVEKAARVLQRVADARGDDDADVGDRKRDAEIASAQAQLVAGDAALDAASLLFDGLGASATDAAAALDRHWRNARTVRSHNPVPYKARIVGDALVNGAEPPYEWYVGTPTTGDAHVPLA
jgi:alkylation response protein AidB-like acyl-CoA dehydrogenase